MAALTEPTGAQVIGTLCVGGGGARIGQWDADSIDANNATLLPIVHNEYLYCVEMLNSVGLDETALSDADYAHAIKALLYGIAYQLIQMSEVANTPISGEKGDGTMQPWYNSRNGQWFTMADQEYLALGITSKYYVNFTAGFAVSTVERATLRGSESCTDTILNPPYTC